MHDENDKNHFLVVIEKYEQKNTVNENKHNNLIYRQCQELDLPILRYCSEPIRISISHKLSCISRLMERFELGLFLTLNTIIGNIG